jgi:CBS domain-containing protein
VKVEDVMTIDVISVSPETPFRTIVDRLFGYDVRGMPVVDHGGRLLGMVTEADLIGKEAFPGPRRALQLLGDALRGDLTWVRKSAGLTAAELMTPDPVTALPDEDLAVVARRMLEKGVKRLPVVRGPYLAGIVSRRDLLRVFERSDDRLEVDVSVGLDGSRHAPAGHSVAASVREGIVTLRGSVESERERDELERTTRAVPGVVHVVNEVTVQVNDVTVREDQPRIVV